MRSVNDEEGRRKKEEGKTKKEERRIFELSTSNPPCPRPDA